MTEPQRNGTPRDGAEPDQEAASGSVRRPIRPGETQPGERVEQAQNLGGPVDVFPIDNPKGRRRPIPSGE